MKQQIKSIVVWVGCFLLVLYVVNGCTPQRLIQRADKLSNKAIKKGAVLVSNVDSIYITDTITEMVTRNDTTYVTRYINNTVTVTEKGQVKYVTRTDKRQERKLAERIRQDSVKMVRLQARLDKRMKQSDNKAETKQERIKNRGRWEWWIIIILVISFALYLYLTNRKNG